MTTQRFLALGLMVSLAGCGFDVDSRGSEVVIPGSPEATGVIRFLNSPDATFELLDIDVALDVRAAKNIVTHVRGADGQLNTDDDDLIDDLDELDAIKYVGNSAIEKIYLYVDSIGAIPNIVVEGVALTAAEVEAIVEVANLASLTQLDDEAALDARAARNIVAARPLGDIIALSRVSYVGPSAITRLRNYAPSWSAPVEPETQECDPETTDPSITPREDANSALWDELLVRSTTLDWPYAEMVAAKAHCYNLDDAGSRDGLIERLAESSGLDWHYGPNVSPWADNLYRGSSAFLAMMNTTKQAMEERTADGLWDPNATPEGAALWAARDEIFTALTARAAADPDAFYEGELFIEAAECSQKAIALVDKVTLEIWIIHRFPQC